MTALRRFQAEAEAVANITHAHIVQVYAIGEAEGLHYMALEYVDGRNLRDFLEKKGIPELPLALEIMRQVGQRPGAGRRTRVRPPGHQAGEHPPFQEGAR